MSPYVPNLFSSIASRYITGPRSSVHMLHANIYLEYLPPFMIDTVTSEIKVLNKMDWWFFFQNSKQ